MKTKTETTTTSKPVYLSTGDLERNREWSAAMIRKFMPEPDRKVEQPGRKNKAHLYLLSRAQEIEATEAWLIARALAQARRDQALAGMDERQLKIVEQAMVRAVKSEFKLQAERRPEEDLKRYHQMMEQNMETGD